MKVYCRGGTSMQKKLAKDLARFCAEKLMTKRLADTLTVTIFFVPDMGDLEGDCEYLDNDFGGNPKQFNIHIGNEDKKLSKQLRTICHEMVHVKQYAKGEMKNMWRPGRYTKYQGELYPDEMDYWDTPWEIEAFGRESGLYVRWVDDRGFTGNEVFDTRNVKDKLTKEERDLLNS